MYEKIYEYMKRIIIYGTNVKVGDTLLVLIPELDEIYIEVFKKIQEDFKLKDVIFREENYKKIYELLKNPGNALELETIVSKTNIYSGVFDTKVIQFLDDSFSKYEKELYFGELSDKWDQYYEMDKKVNSNLFHLLDNCLITVGVCATSEWASLLYGIGNDKIKLWNELFKIIPNTKEEIEEELKKLHYIRDYLNSLDIRELYFNTDNGTDLRVGLSRYSRWATSNEENYYSESGYSICFPSYEIYTSPNLYKIDGTISIERPSNIWGYQVNTGKINFENGMINSISTDNEEWNNLILDKDYKLYRIGEIALVSCDNPISKLNRTFNNLLLDESLGCHLALGASLNECITIKNKKMKKILGFFDSLYHQDIVFGNNTINVECKTSTGKRKILINDGIWKI